MIFPRLRHRRRCCNRAKTCPNPVLSAYLEACASHGVSRIDDTPMIALDLELTGLDRQRDQIIALGWTLLDNGRISFGANRHFLVSSKKSVGESAAIHELRDQDLAEGVELGTALEELFRDALGRTWIFHHATLDIGFLKAACEAWVGTRPCFMVLDTMQIVHRQRNRRDIPVKQGDMQLGRLRDEYGLPRYAAHNAFNDAMATAELTLAIAARLEPDAPLKLKPYVRYY